jgi:hypothetical protein
MPGWSCTTEQPLRPKIHATGKTARMMSQSGMIGSAFSRSLNLGMVKRPPTRTSGSALMNFHVTTPMRPPMKPPNDDRPVHGMRRVHGAFLISSELSFADCKPTSGFAPAPSPRVVPRPMFTFVVAGLWNSACASVLTAMNSTPPTLLLIMRETALLPPPPTPTTRITAFGAMSGRTSWYPLLDEVEPSALAGAEGVNPLPPEDDFEPENRERNVSDMGTGGRKTEEVKK